MLALAGTAAIFCRCRDDPAAANPAIPLLTLRWSFPAKRASVVVTDSEPGRLAPLRRQRPSTTLGNRPHAEEKVMTNGCCGGRQMKAAEHEMSPAFGRILEKRFATARSTRRSLRKGVRSFPDHGKCYDKAHRCHSHYVRDCGSTKAAFISGQSGGCAPDRRGWHAEVNLAKCRP